MIQATINGQKVETSENITILEAAKQLHVVIPTLCYRKGLSVYGGCRMCVVEVEGRKDLAIACNEKLREGMVVQTHSEKVRKVRENIFELIIANHPFSCELNCLTCPKSGSCELKELAEELQITDLKYRFIDKDWRTDNSSLSVARDNSKCIGCGRCIRTCNEIQHIGVLTMTGRGPSTELSTFLNKGMGQVDCSNCGQCIVACPTGTIHEVYHTNRVLSALHAPNKHVVVQTAPAVRVAIGEEFGAAPGTNLEKKMVTALKRMGFDRVFDTNFTADLTIIEEGTEFIHRLTQGGVLPLITSCSPGWIKFAEHAFPDLLDNLSTCKSPQQMFGALSKTYYAEKMGLEPSEIFSVSIMPCTAKKFEMAREEMLNDVDAVLTTREFAKLIKSYGIDFLNLEDSAYDEPFGITTGAAAIFGASGGVMEAALRTAYELITKMPLEDLEFRNARGLEGIKEVTVNIGGTEVRCAVANGLENAWQLLQHKDQYHFIEIMACPGGCIGGGGQPISKDEAVVEKRMKGIYTIDDLKTIRKSHENPAIQKLYETYLGEANGEKAHELLHTHYHKR